MNNREMLEMAAKAAGYSIDLDLGDWPVLFGQGDGAREWNPLEDDGDALRLAVELGLSINFWDGFKQVACRRSDDKDDFSKHGVCGYGDGTEKEPAAENVRLAITIAAAEIGRGMQ